MICPANWIVVSLWETVACYLPPKSPSHLFSCPSMKLPRPSWKNFTLQNTHFGSSKIPEKKSANPTLSTTDIRTNHHHVSGFPDGCRLQGRIQHLKGRIVAYGICLGGGSRWRRRLGWKKLQVEQTTGVVLDVEIAWYLYIYIHMFIYYIYLMIWRDFQDGCTGYLPLFHQNSCQISSFFPARIPRSPAIFPVKLWPLWRTWRQSPTDGEMSFLTLGDVGIKASRTQNGGFFCL